MTEASSLGGAEPVSRVELRREVARNSADIDQLSTALRLRLDREQTVLLLFMTLLDRIDRVIGLLDGEVQARGRPN